MSSCFSGVTLKQIKAAELRQQNHLNLFCSKSYSWQTLWGTPVNSHQDVSWHSPHPLNCGWRFKVYTECRDLSWLPFARKKKWKRLNVSYHLVKTTKWSDWWVLRVCDTNIHRDAVNWLAPPFISACVTRGYIRSNWRPPVHCHRVFIIKYRQPSVEMFTELSQFI